MTSFVSFFDRCTCFCTNQPAHLSRSSPGVGFHPNLHPNQGFIRVRDIYCCCVNWFQNMPELYRIAHYLQPSPTSSPVSRTNEKSSAKVLSFFFCKPGNGLEEAAMNQAPVGLENGADRAASSRENPVLFPAPNQYNPNQIFQIRNGFGFFLIFQLQRYNNTLDLASKVNV